MQWVDRFFPGVFTVDLWTCIQFFFGVFVIRVLLDFSK